MATVEQLLDIIHRLSLLTDEEDDRMHGVYIDEGMVYNGKPMRVVRAKGSTLALIADARQVLKETRGEG